MAVVHICTCMCTCIHYLNFANTIAVKPECLQVYEVVYTANDLDLVGIEIEVSEVTTAF